MRCVVSNCKNDSRHISKSQGITFHGFPTEQSLRLSWLKALGKKSWEPKERSTICSEHFLCEDLYETKGGLRKVRNGAVPVVSQDKCEEELESIEVCRVCLAMDRRLYSIRKYKLTRAFENLTGLSFHEHVVLPQRLCAECASRLLACQRFRSRSLRAHALMMEILDEQELITVESMKTINREKNDLTSKLTAKYFQSDHCDVYIQFTEQTVEQTDAQIKNPDANELDLQVEIKNEVNNEVYLNEEAVDGEMNEEFTNNEPDIGRDYSTDDSLPLEKRRTKKKKTKSAKDAVKKVRKRQAKDPTEPKIDRRRKPFLNDDLNETLFTITNLTFEEQIAEIQKRKESSNYKNSVFKCTACFKGFLDEDAYNGHMTRHTDQCGEHECDICRTHFRHAHALRKHITAHHTQRFSCNQCPYVTTHRQTARLHERWHKGTKYQCPHCMDEFVKFTTYMGHIRIKHPSDFVCELCGYSFVSKKGIELHKKLKHRLETDKVPEDGPYCELCAVRFMSQDAFRRHLHVSARHCDKEKIEANKPKRGKRAKEEAKDPDKGTREKSREPSEKRKMYPSQMRKVEGPIPCEQCGLQLEDSRAYHGHFRRMHPDKNRTNYPSMKSPCMCEVCGRIFQSYALLKDHRWVHTGERPFTCEACGKAFRMRQRLVAHRRVHAQRRATHVCALCGKHFSTRSNRQRHMFIHTGLKPFKCEMCGKCFKHASEKRAHISYVHLKKPWPKRTRGKRRIERQGQQDQSALSMSASEMDIAQPPWASCDPKLGNDMNSIMNESQRYYNIKI